MKALFVAPQPMYEDRGTPIALRQVLHALSELGHQVDILTFPVGRSLEMPGVAWHRTANPFGFRHVPVGFSWRKVVLDAFLTRELSRRISGTRYDWIHAVEEAAFPAAVLARRHGIPLLYDMQSSLPDQLIQYSLFRLPGVRAGLRRSERWLLKRADLVMASQGLKAHVARTAPATPCREWDFPSVAPFVEESEAAAVRRELGLAGDEKVVMYSGTFEPYQGLSMLIDAAVQVLAIEPGCRFVLLGGEARTARRLDRLVAARGLGARVTVLPRQPRERVWAYLANADIVVSPRCFGDNLPLKIIDYLAMGKPIVATDIPAHASALDASCAELVPVAADGLASGILQLLHNPHRSAEIAQVAARRGQAQYGWNGFVKLVSEAVDSLTARSVAASAAHAWEWVTV